MGTNKRNRDSDVLADIAAQLRAEAARKRMSLREVSRRSGMPYATVQKSMAGKRMIDVAELAALCYALSVSPSILFSRLEPTNGGARAPADTA